MSPATLPESSTPQTAFEVLDLIKQYYAGTSKYTAFQIIEIIKTYLSKK